MDCDIDIVVLWVDGADPNWLKVKEKYSKEKNSSDGIVRFRDWEILQYWFRGVEKYMPWVRKVHFVTWGHIPKWLNIKHPKLNIVRHEEFIPEKYLPTFNSPVIEMNIHRIKGLAENFIYFNDDMFPLKSMKKEDFFLNGKPLDSAIMNAISFNPSAPNESYIQFNNAGLINKNFNKKNVIKANFSNWFSIKYGKNMLRNILLYSWPNFTGFYTYHIPTSMLKSTYEHIWEREYDYLNTMCFNKFRNYNMINQWLVSEWQMCENNFVPRKNNFGFAYELTEDLGKNEKIYNLIENQAISLICINDYVYDNQKFIIIKNRLIESFDKILSEKSSFEI